MTGDFIDVRVTEVRTEADRVVSLRLARGDQGDLPSWEPGAHIEVATDDGTIRHYSLCSDPADTRSWRIAVLREKNGRGGSERLHTIARPGLRLAVRGPRHTFPYRPGRERILFVAGGIGITPILPMLAAAERAGADWRLLYLGAAESSMAFVPELRPYGDRVDVLPAARTGPVDLEALVARHTAGGPAHLVACGPPRLLDALEELAAARSELTLSSERFSPQAPAAATAAGEDKGFDVETRDGRVVTVAPDESILDALDRAGVRTLSSCRQGTCGTCETPVLAGVPEHRDDLLTEQEHAENRTMLLCVSRSAGPRLTLDV
ncbi:oxidoreductase [Streptomyces antnestii]|uniref:Oxidoreductase n=1 Tax=Streptomyces antnestii TaxID=2494256 RepID=A0A3S2VK86_9ACTN|nr:PDR/VanB family oxidoreductase [Streptomyces sp. San01]RVU27851.1 oxidoreductase [Streptomyces sp. San01]